MEAESITICSHSTPDWDFTLSMQSGRKCAALRQVVMMENFNACHLSRTCVIGQSRTTNQLTTRVNAVQGNSMKCRICQNDAHCFAGATVLRRHAVEYFRCVACGFIQTQEPTWLDEAYDEVIAAGDIGLVGRNLFLSGITHSVLSLCLQPNGRFLDFGGGYGLFVRLMRDRGFDFRWEDPFCKNLFVRGFEVRADERFDAVTAFEVFEHLPNPVRAVEEMVARADSIFFSTELQPPGPPKPSEWWYYALESGQHLALYTQEALVQLGAKFGMRLLTNGRNLHLFTKRKVSPFWFRLACSGRLSPALNWFTKRKSLLASDHAQVLSSLGGS